MSDSATAQAPHGETASSTAMGVVFLAMAFGVLFVVIVLTIYFQTYVDQAKAQRSEGWRGVDGPESGLAGEYFTLRNSAEAELSSPPSVVGSEIRIPIEMATQAVIADYQTINSESN